MARDENTLLGTVAKTHGVRGDLIIRTTDPSFDLKEDWESIFLQIDGIMVPFFISFLRPFKSGEWVVKLDWYDNKTEAEKLMGYQVWAPVKQMKPSDDELYMDELIGFRMVDKLSGHEGIITEFVDIPENPVFEVEIDKEKILIPARDEFILEVDTTQRIITFELPEGLI